MSKSRKLIHLSSQKTVVDAMKNTLYLVFTNYGTLNFSTYIKGNTDQLKVRVLNFSTNASFFVTTKDDFIELNDVKYYFPNKSDYNNS
jgi:hypothetical protein